LCAPNERKFPAAAAAVVTGVLVLVPGVLVFVTGVLVMSAAVLVMTAPLLLHRHSFLTFHS
jgi:UPF0716 family protein affecting phage T7 exclusion